MNVNFKTNLMAAFALGVGTVLILEGACLPNLYSAVFCIIAGMVALVFGYRGLGISIREEDVKQ